MMAQTLLDNRKSYRCVKLHAIHLPPPTKQTRGYRWCNFAPPRPDRPGASCGALFRRHRRDRTDLGRFLWSIIPPPLTRRLGVALALGLLLLTAPLAAGDLPFDVKPWSYIDGKIEAIHVPSGLPVAGGRISALLFPEGYHGKPARVVVTLRSMRWPDPARRPYLRPIYTHKTPGVLIGEDGRFRTDRMSLSPAFGGSRHWEPARLEGRVTEWGRKLRGSFELAGPGVVART